VQAAHQRAATHRPWRGSGATVSQHEVATRYAGAYNVLWMGWSLSVDCAPRLRSRDDSANSSATNGIGIQLIKSPSEKSTSRPVGLTTSRAVPYPTIDKRQVAADGIAGVKLGQHLYRASSPPAISTNIQVAAPSTRCSSPMQTHSP